MAGSTIVKALIGGWMALVALLPAAPCAAPLQAPEAVRISLPSPNVGASPIGEARPILAWIDFCQSYAAECAFDRDEPARIALTPRIWASVVAVNRRVNASVRAVTDQDHWKRADRWDLAEDGSGDCEDFQLLKRRMLAEAGLPRRAMRMTVVIDEKGEGHAVLTLITDRGDFILDNKADAVLPWHLTGYTFVKRESQEARSWVSLGGVTAPLVVANR